MQVEDSLLPGSFPRKASSVCTCPPQISAVYYAKLPACQVHVKSHCKRNHTLPGLLSALLLNTDWSRAESSSSSQWWSREASQAYRENTGKWSSREMAPCLQLPTFGLRCPVTRCRRAQIPKVLKVLKNSWTEEQYYTRRVMHCKAAFFLSCSVAVEVRILKLRKMMVCFLNPCSFHGCFCT